MDDKTMDLLRECDKLMGLLGEWYQKWREKIPSEARDELNDMVKEYEKSK